jgi:hypothetical protein
VFEGGCLCGRVRFRAVGEPIMSGRCCCLSCQKLTGTGHSENLAFAASDCTVEGDVTDYEWIADSGSSVTTSFCPGCGSPLFGRSTSMPGLLLVRAGALDDPGRYRPQMMLYAKRRLGWVQHDAGLPTFEAMPPL